MGLFENVIKAYIDTQTGGGGGGSQRQQSRGSSGGQQTRSQPGSNFMQNLFANLTQGSAGRAAQASQQAQAGPTQFQQGSNASASSSKYSGSFGDSDDDGKAKAEESDAKLSIPGGKQRNKSWWHNNLDQALGTEGVGGFVNDVLSYSAPVAIADTFSPEWAYNPVSQEEAAKQTYGGNGPMEFNGEYGMPSADQLQQLTPEQQQEWWDDTFNGLNSASSVMMAAGGQVANIGKAGARAIDPVLGLAKKNKGSSKAQRRAYSEAMKDSSSGARNESARGIVEDPAAYGLGEVGPAFGTQPIRSARGKLASEAANELPNSIRYGEMQGPKLRPVAPNSRVSQVAENILKQSDNPSAVEKFLSRTAGQRKPTIAEEANRGRQAAQAAAQSAEPTAAQAAQTAAQAAPEGASAVERAMYGNNLGWALRQGKVGKSGNAAKGAETEYDAMKKAQKEAAEKLEKLEPGTPEYEKQLQELTGKSEDLMGLYADDGEALSKFLGEAEGNLHVGGIAKGRGQKQANVLDSGQEIKLNKDFDKIFKNPSSGNGYKGTTDEELVEFLGDRSLNKLGELDPRVQDIVLNAYQNAIRQGAEPTRMQFNQMVNTAKSAQAAAPFRGQQAMRRGAAGVAGGGGLLGGALGLQTSGVLGGGPWDTPAGFVPTSNVGFGENGDTIEQQETLEKVNEELPEGTAAVPNEEGGVDVVDTDTGELIHNISRQEWYQLSQGDQYRRATQDDEEFANYMRDTYGDAYVGDLGFEGFRDFNTGDKYNVVKDMLGYGDKRGYLPGWREMWEGSGVDFSGDEDQDIRNVMDYMWGEGNIISPDQWIAGGDEYQNAHTLGQKDEALHAAEYFLQQGGGDDLMKALGYPENTLDQEDMALLMMLQNEMNGNRSALKNYGDRDMEQISAILGLGGDTGKFGFDNEAGEEWESMFNPNKDLSWNNLYATAAQTGQLPSWAANLYGVSPDQPGVTSPVLADMADTYMAMIEGEKGKRVKRD